MLLPFVESLMGLDHYLESTSWQACTEAVDCTVDLAESTMEHKLSAKDDFEHEARPMLSPSTHVLWQGLRNTFGTATRLIVLRGA
jgi:hypothetical protein